MNEKMSSPLMSTMSMSDLEREESVSTTSSVTEMMRLCDDVQASMADAEGSLIERVGDLLDVVNAKDQTPDEAFMKTLNEVLDALVYDAAHFGRTSRKSVQSLVDEIGISGCLNVFKEKEIASFKARLEATDCMLEEIAIQRDQDALDALELQRLRWCYYAASKSEEKLEDEVDRLRSDLIKATGDVEARENEIAELRKSLAIASEDIQRRDSQIGQLREDMAKAAKTARDNQAFLREKNCELSGELQHWKFEYQTLKNNGLDEFEIRSREEDAYALEVCNSQLEHEMEKVWALQTELAKCNAKLAAFEGHRCPEVVACACVDAAAAAASAEHMIDGLEDMVLKLESRLRASYAELEREQEQVSISTRAAEDLDVVVCNLKQRLVDDTIAHEEARQKLQEELAVWKTRAVGLGVNAEAEVGVRRASSATVEVIATTLTPVVPLPRLRLSAARPSREANQCVSTRSRGVESSEGRIASAIQSGPTVNKQQQKQRQRQRQRQRLHPSQPNQLDSVTVKAPKNQVSPMNQSATVVGASAAKASGVRVSRGGLAKQKKDSSEPQRRWR